MYYVNKFVLGPVPSRWERSLEASGELSKRHKRSGSAPRDAPSAKLERSPDLHKSFRLLGKRALA